MALRQTHRSVGRSLQDILADKTRVSPETAKIRQVLEALPRDTYLTTQELMEAVMCSRPTLIKFAKTDGVGFCILTRVSSRNMKYWSTPANIARLKEQLNATAS